jgi:hypothetical protein
MQKRKACQRKSLTGFNIWSEYKDSNLGPPAPKAGALPGCATLRRCESYRTTVVRSNYLAMQWLILLLKSSMKDPIMKFFYCNVRALSKYCSFPENGSLKDIDFANNFNGSEISFPLHGSALG